MVVDLLRVHLSRTVGELREDFWGRRQHWVARAPRPALSAPVRLSKGGGRGRLDLQGNLGL